MTKKIQRVVVLSLTLALLGVQSVGIATPSVASADSWGEDRPAVAPVEDLLSGAIAAKEAGKYACIEEGFAITAPSCSFENIQAAIDTVEANDGGTVYLPPCDASMGEQNFQVPAGVSVIGSGMHSTILRDTVFQFNADHYGIVGDGTSRLSSMSVINDFVETNYYFLFRSLPGMRVDHVHFEGKYSTFANVSLPQSGANGYVLFDHCEFDLITSYGIYTFGRNTYFDNIGSDDCIGLFGTDNGSGGSVFVEDCTFRGFYHHLMDGRTGVHYVFRHNTVAYDRIDELGMNGPLEGHGPTYPGENVGTNAIEIYDVTLEGVSSSGNSGGGGILFRSGCGIVYNVTMTNLYYGIAMAVEDSPYHWPRDAASYPIYNQPHGLWFWNVTFQDMAHGEIEVVWQSQEAIQENRDYFLRAPSQALDGFTYTPFVYPHPLVTCDSADLALTGTPADQAIHLNWTVDSTLPATSTWRIDYYSETVPAIVSHTNIVSTTRAYTLTGLTNYEWYTVTLTAVGTKPVLSDTVRVMPTDIAVYLPVIQKNGE